MESFPISVWNKLRIDRVVHTTYFFYKFISDAILRFAVSPLHLNIHAIYFAFVGVILICLLTLMGLIHWLFIMYDMKLRNLPSIVVLKTRLNRDPSSNRLVKQ